MLTMQLLSASFGRPSVYAPWILSFSFPLGAIIALQRYRHWMQASTRASVTVAPPDSDA